MDRPPSSAALSSLLTADGMQPRLCCPKRHRVFACELELGAIPPHPVKHHADTPGQGNSCALLAAELRQTSRPGIQPVRPVWFSITVAAW